MSVVAGARAHVGDRVYPLMELTDHMLASIDIKDGAIEDWSAVLGEPTLTQSDFSLSLNPNSRELEPGDLSVSVWLAWHRASSRIVVGSLFIDDFYLNEHSPGTGDSFNNSDSVILLIDGDHSGPPYGDQDVDLWNAEAQMFDAIPEVSEGPTVELTISSQIGKPGWMLEPPFGDGGGHVAGVHPVVWIVEFFVTPFDLIAWDDPERSSASILEPGGTVGLGFFVLDHDASDGKALTVLNLPGTSYLEGTAADGVLLGADGGDIDSSIQSSSWGRIKASLGGRN